MITCSFSDVGESGLGREIGWGVEESRMFEGKIGEERLSLGFIRSSLGIELGGGLPSDSPKPKTKGSFGDEGLKVSSAIRDTVLMNDANVGEPHADWGRKRSGRKGEGRGKPSLGSRVFILVVSIV